MGHIRLSREADLVVVAPASADLLAKMAHGLADDLASTTLLATDKPVMVAPAMNVMMWANAATQANIATLRARGIHVVGSGQRRPRLRRRRIGPAVGAARHPRCDRARAGPREAAERPQGARHLRPDPRADRSGALHRQPLLRQAGPCHRRGARQARRGNPAGLRPDARSGPGRRRGAPCRDRGADAGGVRSGAAGRHRGVRRGRRRLAPGAGRQPEAQEERRDHQVARAHRQSRTSSPRCRNPRRRGRVWWSASRRRPSR